MAGSAKAQLPSAPAGADTAPAPPPLTATDTAPPGVAPKPHTFACTPRCSTMPLPNTLESRAGGGGATAKQRPEAGLVRAPLGVRAHSWAGVPAQGSSWGGAPEAEAETHSPEAGRALLGSQGMGAAAAAAPEKLKPTSSECRGVPLPSQRCRESAPGAPEGGGAHRQPFWVLGSGAITPMPPPLTEKTWLLAPVQGRRRRGGGSRGAPRCWPMASNTLSADARKGSRAMNSIFAPTRFLQPCPRLSTGTNMSLLPLTFPDIAPTAAMPLTSHPRHRGPQRS